MNVSKCEHFELNLRKFPTCTSKYTIVIGTKASINKGVDVQITIAIDKRLRTQSISDLIDDGIESSVASMSLVNLFTILPIGVDSKNLKLPLRTL